MRKVLFVFLIMGTCGLYAQNPINLGKQTDVETFLSNINVIATDSDTLSVDIKYVGSRVVSEATNNIFEWTGSKWVSGGKVYSVATQAELAELPCPPNNWAYVSGGNAWYYCDGSSWVEFSSNISGIDNGAVPVEITLTQTAFANPADPKIWEVQSYIDSVGLESANISYSPPIIASKGQKRRFKGGATFDTSPSAEDYVGYPVFVETDSIDFMLFSTGTSHVTNKRTQVARSVNNFITFEIDTAFFYTGANFGIAAGGGYFYNDTLYVFGRYSEVDPIGSSNVVLSRCFYKKSANGISFQDSTNIENVFDSLFVASEYNYLIVNDTLIFSGYGRDSTETMHVRVLVCPDPSKPEDFIKVDVGGNQLATESAIITSGDSLIMFVRHTPLNLLRSYSLDNGLSWSDYELSTLPAGLDVTHPICHRLPNNYLIMGARYASQTGAGYILSSDEGRTWTGPFPIDRDGRKQEYNDFTTISGNKVLMAYGIEDPLPIGGGASTIKFVTLNIPTAYQWTVSNGVVSQKNGSAADAVNQTFIAQLIEDYNPTGDKGYGFSTSPNNKILSPSSDAILIETGDQPGLYQKQHNVNISKVAIGKEPDSFSLDLSAFTTVNFLPMRLPLNAGVNLNYNNPPSGALAYSTSNQALAVGQNGTWRFVDRLPQYQIGYGDATNLTKSNPNFLLRDNGQVTLDVRSGEFGSMFRTKMSGSQRGDVMIRNVRSDIAPYTYSNFVFERSGVASLDDDDPPDISATDLAYGYVGARTRIGGRWEDIAGVYFTGGGGTLGSSNASGKIDFRTGTNSADPVIRMTIPSDGGLNVGAGAFTAAAGVINAQTGIRINDLAAAGEYLRGNGTNFVSSTIQESDLPTRPATDVTVTDAGGYFTGTEIEAVTQEIGADLYDQANLRALLGIQRGAVSSSTDASGQISVGHGLSSTPSAVIVTSTTNDSWIAVVVAKNSTQFTVKFFDETGAAVASTSAGFDWIAIE